VGRSTPVGRSGTSRPPARRLADGARELLTSYHPGEGEPWPFYRRFGFEPTGEIDDGEIVLRLDLTGGGIA
jgi:diamine N-acetyltransferase